MFWKSSSPPGQEYVLLGTTNNFTYLTGDLDPSKTYFFYIKASTGIGFFYSNVVELFVSCGKGVVLSVTPPTSPPPQNRTVPIDAVNFNNPFSTQNHSSWYAGANGGINFHFPGVVFPLHGELYDMNVNGTDVWIYDTSASYDYVSPGVIYLTFNIKAKGHPYVAQGFGYGVRFYYLHPDASKTYSSEVNQPIMAGNDSYRIFNMSITLAGVI